jgi:hypothetical protein
VLRCLAPDRRYFAQALQQQQQAQQLHQLHQLQQMGFDIRDLVAAGAGGAGAAAGGGGGGGGGGSAAAFDPMSAVQPGGSGAGSATGGVESAFAGIPPTAPRLLRLPRGREGGERVRRWWRDGGTVWR